MLLKTGNGDFNVFQFNYINYISLLKDFNINCFHYFRVVYVIFINYIRHDVVIVGCRIICNDIDIIAIYFEIGIFYRRFSAEIISGLNCRLITDLLHKVVRLKEFAALTESYDKLHYLSVLQLYFDRPGFQLLFQLFPFFPRYPSSQCPCPFPALLSALD